MDPALTTMPSIHMQQPNIPQLQHQAHFQVGDRVTIRTNNAKWLITARYWSPRQGCIMYDLVFERNGVVADRMAESELNRWVG